MTSAVGPRPGRESPSGRSGTVADDSPSPPVRSKSRFNPIQRFRTTGLQTRVTVMFALGALLLSVLLASSTWLITRSNQIRQRESVAANQMLANAVRMETQIQQPEAIPLRLNDMPTADARPLAIVGDEAIRPGSDSSRDLPPPALRQLVEEEGGAGRMRIDNETGQRLLVLGVAFPDEDAAYYEFVPLDSLNRDLRTLAISLSVAAVVTTFLGAMLGSYASRRTLTPLSSLSDATHAISSGELNTRLPASSDSDLNTIINSFNEMAESLQDRIERDARFASDVSHELRSPLTTLTASIEVLDRRQDELPEPARTAVGLLKDDVERFQQLVNDLLEISRFDSGAQTLSLDTVQASEIVAQAVSAMGHGHVPTQVSPAAVHTMVTVDKRRIVQVLRNLLDNAEKYGGGATHVTVDEVDGMAIVAVVDAGPGVDESERRLIFDRFARGGESGRRGNAGGVGLGLSLVAEHVALHGGDAWVEDRIDSMPGSRFVISLPVETNVDDGSESSAELSEGRHDDTHSGDTIELGATP